MILVLLSASAALAQAAILRRSPGSGGLPGLPKSSVPRGWRSWNRFELRIDEALIRSQIDGLKRTRFSTNGKPTSLFDLGYTSIGIDDGWQDCTMEHKGGTSKESEWIVGSYHDEKGHPRINKTRFPDMGALVKYAHSKGVTMGWYMNSCFCREQGATHYEQDAKAAANFGFDHIKIDNCGPDTNMKAWRKAVRASSKPNIELENCRNYNFLPTEGECPGEVFRSTEDNSPDWLSILANLLTNSRAPGADPHGGLPTSHPGCWAYPDALELLTFQKCRQDLPAGTCNHASPSRREGGLTLDQTRAHFAAWCVVSSPLILGHDLSTNPEYDAAWPIISNAGALRVNQAWAGDPGRLVAVSNETRGVSVYHGSHCECVEEGKEMPEWSLWAKRLDEHDTEVAVVAINHMTEAWKSSSIPLDEIVGRPVHGQPTDVTIQNVWTHRVTTGDAGDTVNGLIHRDSEGKLFWVHPNIADQHVFVILKFWPNGTSAAEGAKAMNTSAGDADTKTLVAAEGPGGAGKLPKNATKATTPKAAGKLPKNARKGAAASKAKADHSPGLPEGWKETLDPKTNHKYYWNVYTKETQWTKPTAPAKSWATPSAPAKRAAPAKGGGASTTRQAPPGPKARAGPVDHRV